jgi:hypothetical protein
LEKSKSKICGLNFAGLLLIGSVVVVIVIYQILVLGWKNVVDEEFNIVKKQTEQEMIYERIASTIYSIVLLIIA